MTKTWRDYFYVSLQGLLFLGFLGPWSYPLPLKTNLWVAGSFMALGIIIIGLAMLQLNTTLTPWPTPKKGGRLVTQGVFKRVRHPIYSGIFLAAAGWAFYQHNLYLLGLALALLTVFYFKSKYEEKRLRHVFPQYKTYQKKTGRFLPNLPKSA